MDLTEYPIKLHQSKRMAERIQDEILNDYPEKKGKIILPVITDVLADCIGGIKQPLDLADLEQKVNDLRHGSTEDKAVYLVFRKQLIEYDCMPVDEKGKPYDLSLMHISGFKNDGFLDELCLDNPELLNTALVFYRDNKKEESISMNDFARCLNLMKEEKPTAYVQLYNYLSEKKFIPASPLLSTISLTKEQFAYIVHVDKAKADEYGRARLMPTIIDYVTKNIKGPETLDNINKTIAMMRYGTLEEQENYAEFCEMVLGMPIILPEYCTVQEQREKLLAKAERKAKAQLEKA
ncbi:MAG: hypothetical protein QW666_04460 [Candidatus Woesearchaeota archaeon]